jgi:hypothetical protein
VRDMIAFALGAFIGDIHRFAKPGSLVKYVGLNPAFDSSGQEEWSGGIGGHGHKYLRSLLIEGAQAILRCGQTPLAKWGKKLLASKGEKNLAVAAIARKLTVSVWYLMMGRWTPLEEIEPRLEIKLGKIIGQIGAKKLEQLGQTRQALRQAAHQTLKARVHQPAPKKEATPAEPAPKPATVQAPATAKPRRAAKVYALEPNKKFTPKSKTKSLAK